MQTITSPSAAASWTSPSASSTVIASSVGGIAALRHGSTIRLFYIDGATGNVAYIDSTNNGSSWGSAVTVHSGGLGSYDLVCAYDENGTTANGPWFFGFTYYDGLGHYTPYFGYYNGSAWVATAYSSGWRAAGIDAYNVNGTAHTVLVYRQSDSGSSRLRALDKTGATYANAIDIDQTQAGLFGLEMNNFRFVQLSDFSLVMGIIVEHAGNQGVYAGICTTLYQDEILVDEPIMFPAIEIVTGQPYLSVGTDGTDVYLAGDTVVYRGAAQAATSSTLTPIRYTYDDHDLEIEFKAGIDTLYVGQILVVTTHIDLGQSHGIRERQILYCGCGNRIG